MRDQEPSAESSSQVREWAVAYLRHAPFSLCLRELNRMIAMEEWEQGQPARAAKVLDVGCGDGFWWTLRDRTGRRVCGVDISTQELNAASSRIETERADISKVRPFPTTRFDQVIGNCSLEHVRDIDSALKNIRACAEPDGTLVLFVPAAHWAYKGLLQETALKYAPRLAMAWAGALNGFFQHWHLYDVPVWRHLLEQNGWKVVEVMGVGSGRSEFLYRLFLPTGLVAFWVKALVGRYPNRLLRWCPKPLMAPGASLLRWALREPVGPADSKDAYEYMIIARAQPVSSGT